LARAVNTGTFTHAVTGTYLLTNSATPGQRVGAGNGTLVATDRYLTGALADNTLATEVKSELGAGSGATASVLEAESGLGSRAGSTESTFEALGTGASTIGLDAGKSSVVVTVGVLTIVVGRRVDPLAAVRSGVSRA